MWVLLLVIGGLALGRVKVPGWFRWLFVLGAVGGTHFALLGADPIMRMVGICVVLLGTLKGFVYAEWGGFLRWRRYLIFGFGWFGMDAGTFEKRREGLAWKDDVWIGLGLIGMGTVLGIWVAASDWRQVLVMFLPMSLGFHFGALRVLKGVHRANGFAVRTLFPNVLKARGVGDFWSRRWNVGYSQMMQRLVGRPVTGKAGRKVGLMAVFLISGLLHELAITLPVGAGYWLPTLYFCGHGVLVLLEQRWGRPLGKVPALVLVAAPLGLLFPALFQEEVIERCLEVLKLI